MKNNETFFIQIFDGNFGRFSLNFDKNSCFSGKTMKPSFRF